MSAEGQMGEIYHSNLQSFLVSGPTDFLGKLAGKVTNDDVMILGQSHDCRSAKLARNPRIDCNPPFIQCHPNSWNKWSNDRGFPI